MHRRKDDLSCQKDSPAGKVLERNGHLRELLQNLLIGCDQGHTHVLGQGDEFVIVGRTGGGGGQAQGSSRLPSTTSRSPSRS